ncbi:MULTISPECIES: DUF3048 domain-containing protein [Metasolibacillus]|uniref:DUF3048 domain-containing protein n=1 Tax=Metasolibacillus TaxID=2703677 RepID=UPI00079A2922|nr:DUF3048 domain-containing protein [Metasolibacillus fluoroglycofenilyticus]KYG91260.1 hypothetical protein A0U40_14955 [[Bacillus] sp. KCTC 13219]
MDIKLKLLASLCAVFLIAGCGNKAEEKEPEEVIGEVEAEETDTEEESTEEVAELPFKTPFTGEGVAEEIEQRPILATINNHPAARPQSGLASADVVYEMLAEGDVTRFLALYQSTIPEQIGPIRSARSYFIDIAKGLDAFYIAHGYSPEAKSMLANGVVSNINGMHYDGTYFKRSSNRQAPHNSYISGENVLAGAEKVGASMIYSKKVFYPFYRDEDNVKIGVRANEAMVRYSQNSSFNSTYVYDQETGQYKRFSANTVTTDYLTGEEIQLSNILFFEMPHRVIDSVGRRDIDISAGGNAYIFQNGMMREIKWKNSDGFLVPLEEDGSEVKLVQGKSWIHFVPTTPGLASAVTYSE